MTDFRNELAVQVRRRREGKDWSQTELARRWGRSRHSVVRLEKGEIDADLDTMAQLAEVFGLSLAEFVWPIIAPEAAAAEQERAQAQFSHEMGLHWQERRERYLAALNEPQAVWVLQFVNTIAALASQGQMKLVLAMLRAIAGDLVAANALKVSAEHADEASLISARSGLPWAVQSE